eukprot:363653_1
MVLCCCCFNHNSCNLDNVRDINIGNLKNQCIRFPHALSRTKYSDYDNDHFQGLYKLHLPILYVTANDGCLMHDTCTNENLIDEFKDCCTDEKELNGIVNTINNK